MNKYPVLAFIVKYGTPAAAAAAVVAFLLIAWLAWPFAGVVAVLVALFVAAILFVIAKSYVELVTIITDMLLPQ